MWDTNGQRRSSRIAVGALAVASVLTMATAAPSAAGGSTNLIDTGSLSAITAMTGAQAMWNNGFTGQGIGVAVIDTGVARVPGLDAPGKVIDGPDLSFDSQSPNTTHVDAFGHGTHIAGIIAGSDVQPGAPASAYTDATRFVGVAPQAKIINVKVGAYDGSVDVTQVIAAINWVVQHRNDPGLNIRVLNLSFGTDSVQPAQVDPLAYAVEVAWNAGIVVVAAAGNDGTAPGPLADPASSPAVIAVGATDPLGTLSTVDDVVAPFAQHGTTQRPVDVAAPGVSVASLAVPGSFVDQNVTTGKIGTRFQRASGTSQSTAVVSGLVALMLSKYPTASPDAIKTYLKLVTSGATAVGGTAGHVDDNYRGAGSADISAVAAASTSAAGRWLRTIPSRLTTGTGAGLLEASRGTYHVLADGVPLAGEIDIFANAFDSAAVAAAAASQTSWSGGLWNGQLWTGDGWDSGTWSGAEWTGTDWTGARWSGARWSGARWSAGTWDGARWSGARWSDDAWS